MSDAKAEEGGLQPYDEAESDEDPHATLDEKRELMEMTGCERL